MTQKISLLSLSVLATAALTAERFVTATGAVPAALGNAIGVANADAAIGELTPVDVLGTTIVIAEAAVAVGAALEVGAAGGARTKTTGVTVARALQAAAAANDRIEILLIAN